MPVTDKWRIKCKLEWKKQNSRFLYFFKHLEIFHPERQGDPSVFKLKVEATYQKCLERQVSEGVSISNSKADYLMNSKTEYMQPSVSRVIATRQVRDSGSWRDKKLFRTEFFINFCRSPG